jgi:transposase
MSIKEAQRLHILKLYQAKRITMRKVAEELNISIRQGRRLWKRFKKDGIQGLVSLRRGKPSPNKIPTEIVDRVMQILSEERYRGFGPTLFAEKLKENHQIDLSNETLRKIMI